MYPKDLDSVLNEVASRRCAECHKDKVPRKFYTRMLNPENNSFMLAPLSKSAGGTGKCGPAIFQSTEDPDYRKLMAVFQPLRANVPELLDVAQQVRRREVIGLAAYKPPNSHPENEKHVFDFVGMLGLPLVPCYEFPAKAPAAFFSVHALKDPTFTTKLAKFIRAGKPVLLTDGLTRQLAGKVRLDAPNVHVLPVNGEPKSLLQLTQPDLDSMRAPLLRPFNAAFTAPNQVALYLFRDGSWVVENFTDAAVTAELNGRALTVAARGWQQLWNK